MNNSRGGYLALQESLRSLVVVRGYENGWIISLSDWNRLSFMLQEDRQASKAILAVDKQIVEGAVKQWTMAIRTIERKAEI